MICLAASSAGAILAAVQFSSGILIERICFMNAFKRDKVTVDSGARRQHCRSNKLRSADISVVPAEDQEIKATCDDQMGLCRTDLSLRQFTRIICPNDFEWWRWHFRTDSAVTNYFAPGRKDRSCFINSSSSSTVFKIPDCCRYCLFSCSFRCNVVTAPEVQHKLSRIVHCEPVGKDWPCLHTVLPRTGVL